MTIVAIRAAGDVRRVLAGRGDAVMAGSTSTDHLSVVDRDRGLEQRRAVTVFADSARLNMRRALACSSSAIVATNAVVGDAGVVEQRRQPPRRVMAVVALIAGRDVGWRLSGCLDAVVAAEATAAYG